MECLFISLLGRFSVSTAGENLVELGSQKARELFSYLMIYRKQLHSREKLTNMLWENSSVSQSKSYFRQTLWQIQSSLGKEIGANNNIFLLESDWIQVNPTANFILDVCEIENVISLTRGLHGSQLDQTTFKITKQVMELYKGDLLENWYHDWCIFERERFQNMYLAILSKLIEYCEWNQDYDAGISYGTQILKYDIAHESTYRKMMRLHYYSGERTKAIHTFNRCTEEMDRIFNIQPSRRTIELYKIIKADQLEVNVNIQNQNMPLETNLIPQILDNLIRFRQTLMETQRNVENEINFVKTLLNNRF